MIYKPQNGQIKDDAMFYHEGKFYLFSMYHKEDSDVYNNIWLAISDDGVNFQDYGCVVEDFPSFIWAMKVYPIKDGFMMNSGSFDNNGSQSVLKFWYSKDLIHWEYKPELDVVSPTIDGENIRLDCMYVISKNDRYYGYATGQFGYLTSKDGMHWEAHRSNIDYSPFPVYNRALGGFEIADCIEFDDKYYLFCGGFGHLGMNGYGVYIYESNTPDGIFKPHLPNYRINGASKRWVNMWERFFNKDGEFLTANYMYDGYSYECGDVWLPPIKKLAKDAMGLHLEWWSGNGKMIGELYAEYAELSAHNGDFGVFDDGDNTLKLSNVVPVEEKTVVEFDVTLLENTFTEYSAGGFYLDEGENQGTAIVFDTYGKCEILAVKDSAVVSVDDVISFGSTAPYWLDSGVTYKIRVLVRDNMFEVYVNNKYLQTFNTTHYKEVAGKFIKGFAAVSRRRPCTLRDIKLYKLNV